MLLATIATRLEELNSLQKSADEADSLRKKMKILEKKNEQLEHHRQHLAETLESKEKHIQELEAKIAQLELDKHRDKNGHVKIKSFDALGVLSPLLQTEE